MTKWEQDVTDLAIRWRRATFAAEKSQLQAELSHAIDMVLKERRDAKAEGLQPGKRVIQVGVQVK